MNLEQTADFITACQWDASRFLIVSGNVFDPFIYYSHLLPMLLSLAIGIFVLRHDKGLLGKTLGAIVGLFSVWAFIDLVLWATERPEFTMFFWSIVNLVEPMIYAACAYFVVVFVTGKDMSLRQKILLLTPLIPTVFLAPTALNLVSFDLTNCNREALEGSLVYYNYLIEILYVAWIVGFAVVAGKRNAEARGRIALVTSGIVLFLIVFAWGNFVGSFTDDWRLPQWGLLGMPIFLAFLAYLIVRYNVFHVKVVWAQILVFASVVLVGSLLFAPTLDSVHSLVLPTLLILVVLGILLVRGVLREVRQREEIQALAKRQESLIHLITHDVKGALTNAHSLMSEIREGDFGVISDELRQAVSGLDATTTRTIEMTTSVLRASDAKTGRMAFSFQPFDLRQAVLEAVAYIQQDADAKKLQLKVEIDNESNWMFVGDKAQILEHVFRNLVTNAVLYTPAGSVTLNLQKLPEGFRFSVADTGVGITAQDKANLFTEGGHGKDSTKINVHSTGYGLFLAKAVVEAHHGRIWAESAGQNKGSTFIVELPINAGANLNLPQPKATQ